MGEIKISVDFGGGLEGILIRGSKEFEMPLSRCTSTVQDLIIAVLDGLIEERKQEVFVTGGQRHLRPGILALVNDTDWELLDGPNTILKDGDRVSFISTLHGG